MNSFYSIKLANILYYILTIQLLIKYQKLSWQWYILQYAIGGNNGDIHKSLKYCIQNFKTSLKNINLWNQHILCLEENKFKGREKPHSTGQSHYTQKIYLRSMN